MRSSASGSGDRTRPVEERVPGRVALAVEVEVAIGVGAGAYLHSR